MNRILEFLIPFTIISSYNKEAKLPLWAKPLFSIYTQKKIWVFCKKVRNEY